MVLFITTMMAAGSVHIGPEAWIASWESWTRLNFSGLRLTIYQVLLPPGRAPVACANSFWLVVYHVHGPIWKRLYFNTCTQTWPSLRKKTHTGFSLLKAVPSIHSMLKYNIYLRLLLILDQLLSRHIIPAASSMFTYWLPLCPALQSWTQCRIQSSTFN